MLDWCLANFFDKGPPINLANMVDNNMLFTRASKFICWFHQLHSSLHFGLSPKSGKPHTSIIFISYSYSTVI